MDIIEIQASLQNLTNSKISLSQIGEILGVSRAAISKRAKLGSDIGVSELRKIEQFYKVELLERDDQINNQVKIDYYPDVFGSCGTGFFVPSERKEQIQVPVNSFIKRISTTKKYSVINAKGDSMQPFIYGGDKLLVEHWEGEQIIDNQVYVFCYENEIFVKRLTKNINQLIIKSDNKEYDTIKLVGEDLNKIIIVGQVVGLIRDII